MLSTRYNGKLVSIIPSISGGYFWIVQGKQTINHVGIEQFVSLALLAAFDYIATTE